MYNRTFALKVYQHVFRMNYLNKLFSYRENKHSNAFDMLFDIYERIDVF